MFFEVKNQYFSNNTYTLRNHILHLRMIFFTNIEFNFSPNFGIYPTLDCV